MRLFVFHTIQSGMTVFDIGAHAGYYTLIASRLVGGPLCGRLRAGLSSSSQDLYRHLSPRFERSSSSRWPYRIEQASGASTRGSRKLPR